MNIPGLRSFLKGREEIHLYTPVAAAYYFSLNDSVLTLAGWVFLLFTGAISYRLHEIIRETRREAKKAQESMNDVRQRKYREGVLENESSIGVDEFNDLVSRFTPDNDVAVLVGAGGYFFNIIFGALLFVWIVSRIVSPLSAEPAAIALFAAPTLSGLKLVASYVWSA